MTSIHTPGWEQSKENAAPLRRGRNIAAQEQASKYSPQETQDNIKRYESLVRPSEPPHVTEMESDPLSHWLEYIKFYQSAFPTDTREQFLLMERCTRALVKMKQYVDDDRFIGVCAKYADKTKDPGQVFKYLHQQKIGTTSALFWVAWAFVAEKDEDFQFAEQIFKKGLSKNAQPLQMLKIRHQQFQRRMSRYWLNASTMNDQFEDDEEDTISRSRQRALGGLSRDRLRRNDRARSSRQNPSFRSSRSSGTQSNSSSQGSSGSFAIFVENDKENGENQSILDHSGVEKNRMLAREADRRKENSMAAERWNERGGLTNPFSRKKQPARPKAPPTAFPVFVDEECAAQHEQEAQDKHLRQENHKQVRDERTFRERTDVDESASILARDPLRYVRDPSKRDKDLAAEEAQAKTRKDDSSQRPTKERKAKIGFDKRLLKNRKGEEQSFEEARANARNYTVLPSSENFNLFKQVKEDTSSQMDCDGSGSFDSVLTDSETNGSTMSNKEQQKPSRKEGRVLFRNEPSFEGSLNQTAISTASSTVHATDAVGVMGKREDETINTKFAMRELSMMFASPGFGVDEGNKKTERSVVRLDRSMIGGTAVNASFDAIGDGIGSADLNNSIINTGYSNDENMGPRNPAARASGAPDLDQMALQEIESEEQDPPSLSCGNQPRATIARSSQQDPLRGKEVPLSENPGFQIFEDEETSDAAPCPKHSDEPDNKKAPKSENLGFHIFEDMEASINPDKSEVFSNKKGSTSESIGFQIFEDEDALSNSKDERKGPDNEQRSEGARLESDAPLPENELFQIFEEGDSATPKRDGSDCSSSSHLHDSGSVHRNYGVSPTGDTVSSSVFNELFAHMKRETASSNKNSPSGVDGDTITSSVFNEVVGSLQAKKSLKTAGVGCSIFVEEEEEEHLDDIARRTRSRLMKSYDTEINDKEHVVDYSITHERDVRMALQRVHASASVASDSKCPLASLLSQKDESYHLPHVPLPREFRKKFLKMKTRVRLGKHEGTVMKELGRGAYGVVVLMESSNGKKNDDTIAVKVQSPTDCLAWEYQILLRLEHRVSSTCSGAYPFPRALSFLSLADGGMFGMTTGSKSGLNIIDLVNIYASTNESVPELLALHYTSKMLRLVEMLHWHGRVLHCDVKPDNFVLSDISVSGDFNIKYSDLVLVDFGRAVDLDGFSNEYKDVRKAKLIGNAAPDDMKCVAMRNGSPWSYDIDTFGILCSAHVMLFGSHMELKNLRDKEWKPAKRMKRYWKQDLWDELFSTILNRDDDSVIGSHARSLRSIREKIDLYLQGEEPTLREQLLRQMNLIPSSREKIK